MKKAYYISLQLKKLKKCPHSVIYEIQRYFNIHAFLHKYFLFIILYFTVNFQSTANATVFPGCRHAFSIDSDTFDAECVEFCNQIIDDTVYPPIGVWTACGLHSEDGPELYNCFMSSYGDTCSFDKLLLSSSTTTTTTSIMATSTSRMPIVTTTGQLTSSTYTTTTGPSEGKSMLFPIMLTSGVAVAALGISLATYTIAKGRNREKNEEQQPEPEFSFAEPYVEYDQTVVRLDSP